MDTSWSRHEQNLRRFTRRVVRDMSTADDLLQDAFFQCWRLWQSKSPEEKLRLMKVCIARSYYKRLKRAGRVKFEYLPLELLSTAQQEPQTACLGHEMADLVRERLARLPDNYREVVFRRFFLHESIEQVARAIGRNQNTTKTLLRRGLSRLRCLLESHN
jgi:RNA polymerase sigma factor (sigma-70 family)